MKPVPFLLLVIVLVPTVSAGEWIPLWTDGAPGAKGTTDHDVTGGRVQEGVLILGSGARAVASAPAGVRGGAPRRKK